MNKMLKKYTSYIKESVEEKFKKGDMVVYYPDNTRDYLKKYNGFLCVVTFVYATNLKKEPDYSIRTKEGSTIVAHESELKLQYSTSNMVYGTEKYIENQFEKPKTPENENIILGSRVIVNGKEKEIEHVNRKGTVKKIGPETCLVEFDEDDSKNLSKETYVVGRNFIKLLDEPPIVSVFKEGDKVICVDSNSDMYNQIGIVNRVWDEDNSCMVDFAQKDNEYVSINTFMFADQIKVTEYAKKVEFQSSTNVPSPTNPNVTPTTTYEEEDEDEVTSVNTIVLKKKDLLEFSYKDLFEEEKLSSREDLLVIKSKYEKEIENPDLPKFKKVFIERTLKTIEIIDTYYQFLINKIAKDLPVFRTVEQISDEDLLRNKTKVRASESKELTRKYSFDQGIIAYWKLEDAVVFKTI